MDFRKTVAEIEPTLRRYALRAGWAGGLAAGLLVLAGLELATVTLPAQREAGELRDLGDRPLVVLTAMKPYPKELLATIGLTPEDGLAMQQEWEKLGFDEASWSRHSRHESIADAQHYIQLQRPDRVIAAVTEVVEAVRARPPLQTGP